MSTRRKGSGQRRRRPRRDEQLSLLHRGMWGGARPGAGRPKKKHSGAPHRKRERVTRHQVVHVTWRLVRGLPSLRASKRYRVVKTALRDGREKKRIGPQGGHFRLVEFSVQDDHLHMLIEAGDAVALARGLIGLAVRIARRLNFTLQRRGRLFRDRYHAQLIKTPRQLRNCLVYVLNNRRKHLAQRGLPDPPRFWCDPCSSAPSFRGWRRRPARAAPDDETITVPARTWLMTRGWKRHGLIAVDATPW